MAFIKLQNIDKYYGKTQALFDVSLIIEKGDFVTLLGPSGSGKTTLLKVLGGFEGHNSGSVFMQGTDISTLPPEKRNFGLVFQGYALFPHMSVFKNIAYPLKVRRMHKKEIESRVNRMLELVQLKDFADRKPNELSGGQQQRVALSRALVFEPDLLLLDEPMSALDKKLRVELQDELKRIHQTLGTTFINVTHDQEEAMNMSDRIAVMNHGRIEQYDTAYSLYRRPKTEFVASFIGKSNQFAGEIKKSSNGKGTYFKSDEITFPIGMDHQTGHFLFIIRPEDVRINSAPKEHESSFLEGRVVNGTYSGDRALYVIKTNSGKELLSYGSAKHGVFEQGHKVYCYFDPMDGFFLDK